MFSSVKEPNLVARIPCYTDPVANLTLAIDDELLRRARIRALEDGTSVNSVVREFLTAYASGHEQAATIDHFLEIGDRSNAGSEGDTRTWTRDEIYEDRAGR